MAGIKVDITSKMKSHRPEREQELTNKLMSGLQKAVLTVEGNAKKACPVDTGRLRSSITNKIEGSTGIVGTNVEYARYVEHGTSNPNYPAQPFLFPAFEQVRARIMEFFK